MNVSAPNEKNSRNKETDSLINLRFFSCKGIGDEVDLPSEKTVIRRTLELDLGCATRIVLNPVCIRPRVGDIGNFEVRNYKPICLVIG